MKREDLVINRLYLCKLSELKMMIVEIDDKGVTQEGKKAIVVFARYFNPASGKFERTNITDNQLEKIKS